MIQQPERWRRCRKSAGCCRGFVFLACIFLCGPAGAAEHDNDEQLFINTHQEKVVDCLRQIHLHAMTKHDRFLILASASQHYVQCLYHDNDTRIYCEASNGTYGPNGRLPLADDAIALIKKSGFEDTPEKNFNLDLPFGGNEDYSHIANLMLQTIHTLYRPGVDYIEMKAPFCGQSMIVS